MSCFDKPHPFGEGPHVSRNIGDDLRRILWDWLSRSPHPADVSMEERDGLHRQTVEEAIRQFSGWLVSIRFGCLLCSVYYQYVRSFFRQRIACRATADDLTQQTILLALRSVRAGGVLPVHPKAWLLTIARNLEVDRKRLFERQKEIGIDAVDETKLGEKSAPPSSQREELAEILHVLERAGAPHLVEIVLLRLKGWSNAKVARNKGVHKRTVEKWWKTVRKILSAHRPAV